jgi:single-strand DNA-binding protein
VQPSLGIRVRRTAPQLEDIDVVRDIDRCTAWRGVAENAAKSLKKGQRVMVIGKLIQRSFETEGQKRTTVEIQVQHVGPDLKFQSASVGPRSSAATSAEEEQKV